MGFSSPSQGCVFYLDEDISSASLPPFSGLFNEDRCSHAWIQCFDHEIRTRIPARDLNLNLYLECLKSRVPATLKGKTRFFSMGASVYTALHSETIQMLPAKFVSCFPCSSAACTEQTHRSMSDGLYMEIYKYTQRPGEPIKEYLQRTRELLRKLGGRDRSEFIEGFRHVVGNGPDLNILESATLDTILFTFARGLLDPSLQVATQQFLLSKCQSLNRAYYTLLQLMFKGFEIKKEFDRVQATECFSTNPSGWLGRPFATYRPLGLPGNSINLGPLFVVCGDLEAAKKHGAVDKDSHAMVHARWKHLGPYPELTYTTSAVQRWRQIVLSGLEHEALHMGNMVFDDEHRILTRTGS